MKIIAISGSIRKSSFNTGLLRKAQQIAPKGVQMVLADIDLPLFNQDNKNTPPEKVLQFFELLKSSDSVLISTPEHNYQFSAALKNALDWASAAVLPGATQQVNLWNDKPCAILSAGGGVGGIRAQLGLRQSAVFLNV